MDKTTEPGPFYYLYLKIIVLTINNIDIQNTLKTKIL